MRNTLTRLTIGTVAVVLGIVSLRASAQEKRFGLKTFIPADTSRLLGSPDPLPPLEIEKAFPNLRFERPLAVTHAGDGTNRIFVVTQKGIVYVFPNRSDTTEQERKIFLDWSKIVRTDENEEGMMGLAFHPKFKENRLFYVYYTTRPLQSVVARFRVTMNAPNQADPESFEKMMHFPQPYSNHNGGSMEFGPDGYLYIGLGDGGSGGDPHRNGQNLQTLLGKILRIDVDHQDPGLKYSIPKDNPFADRRNAVRKEIWAYGVRNIWRLSFDRLTGTLWAGDVGQDKYEEVDVIVKGANYGWNLKEGFHAFRPDLAEGDEKLIEPLIEYDHSVGKSVTGGVVYRGKELPELYGAYLYADYVSGYIWALRYDGQKMTSNLEISRVHRDITSFGQDEANEVRFTCFDGYIYRFRKAEHRVAKRQPPFPRTLSETRCFTLTKTMTPAPGLIPYTVNVPLWSDHAAKERYLALPKGTSVTFSPQDHWEFPVGTILVKTFFLNTNRGKLKTQRRLETRFMVHSQRGWDGYTYLWNDEQTEAQLLDTALTRDYRIRTPQGEITQSWYFPSRADCMACHTQAAGFVLGLNTRQMNREQDYGLVTDNQMRTLNHLGIFERELPVAPAKLESHPDWGDALQQPRIYSALARAYLDVNCAICHCPGGTSNTSLDLRFHTPLADMKLINALPAKGEYGHEGSRIITPGDPEHSVLLARMKTRGQGRMPNLASSIPDEQAIEVIRLWIKSLK